jgi:hypothetical protein
MTRGSLPNPVIPEKAGIQKASMPNGTPPTPYLLDSLLHGNDVGIAAQPRHSGEGRNPESFDAKWYGPYTLPAGSRLLGNDEGIAANLG